ncbi:hypothetical protein WH91_18680 [Devosia psychrophila]|uniref:2-methylaconitate cis-trans isomerase n=1 Tax=Devosia psychrophila TaxID=728005 RepID=A0ABR5DU98_9HYPH|nr:PrpF domain-containing protein [Devosia psychrophila]KKC31578.1 hypothetical protein WH91_18680 [Devosia psychrophila]
MTTSEQTGQVPVRAVYMRGGTSKGVFFVESDLPPPGEVRDRLLLSLMGSPDRYGRQLNGMGGGISSVSKIIIARASTRNGVDIEYIHGQVAVDRPVVDWSANCGNLSSAVAQFAVEAGLAIAATDGEVLVKMVNLNSGMRVDSRFTMSGGKPRYDGNFEMPGVSDGGARVALEYFMPHRPLFGSSQRTDVFEVDGRGIACSIADATLPCVFLMAGDIGLDVSMTPSEIDTQEAGGLLLERLRCLGAVKIGLAADEASVPQASPKIGVIGAPVDYVALDGEPVSAKDYDIAIRMMSMGKAHKAVPLTAAMCLAAAALCEGSVPNSLVPDLKGTTVRLGTPSGIISVGAVLIGEGSALLAERTIVHATSRRLMAGEVYGSLN